MNIVEDYIYNEGAYYILSVGKRDSMPKQSIIVRPTVEQITSGKVQRPEIVYVSTLLAELPGDEKIFLRTMWQISDLDENLVFLEGILDWDPLIEPLRGPPDSHLRAARRVTAAVFGKERFRGEVEVSGPDQLEVIFRVTISDDTWFLPTIEDVDIWTKLRHAEKSKVERISLVDFLRQNPDLDKKEFLDQLMLRSTILRTRIKSLYSRRLMGKLALSELSRIEEAGIDTNIITDPYIVNRLKMIGELRE